MSASEVEAGLPEPDPCVVDTVPLCGLVKEFVEGWLTTRRSRKGQWETAGENAVDPVSPYAWLAFDTGLPEAEIRKVRNPARYPLAELRVADALTASIGDPGMWHDGTFTVMPSPLVHDARRHAECCGGSDRTAPQVTSSAIIRSGQAAAPQSRLPEEILVRLEAFARAEAR